MAVMKEIYGEKSGCAAYEIPVSKWEGFAILQ